MMRIDSCASILLSVFMSSKGKKLLYAAVISFVKPSLSLKYAFVTSATKRGLLSATSLPALNTILFQNV